MLVELIRTNAADFGLIDIHAEPMLRRARQTSFSWSTSPGTVCLAVNQRYFQQARANTNVVAIVCPPLAASATGVEKCLIVAEKAAELFYFLHNQAIHKSHGAGDFRASGRIAGNAHVAASAIIGQQVEIGEKVVIDHGCIVLDNTIIGDGTVIGPGCVIAVDGLFAKHVLGRKVHVRHYGGVRIGRNCKLHSGVIVSRSANYTEYTEIEEQVHIGHRSVIGHDCRIGSGTDISAMALIAGRARLGRQCWIGANATISNACSIGDGAKVRIGAVVIADVQANGDVSGNFAIPHREQLNRTVGRH